MKATYNRCYSEDAQGFIVLDKPGPCSVSLVGAASMSQEELNFYGELFAKALSRLTPEQRRQVEAFKPRI